MPVPIPTLTRTLLLACLAVGGPARAEEDEEAKALERFMSLLATRIQVASPRETTVLTAPSVVAVVDRETLRDYGVRTVAEAVALVPGMSVWRTSFFRDVLTARGVLQEHYSNRVLLLIEGIPVWEASTGAAVPSRIAVEDVERIEVLKGPASVLYGSNAYAGAVNVVLRRPKAPERSLVAGLEDQGGAKFGAQVFHQGEAWSLLVGAHGERSLGETLQVPGEGGTSIRDAESLETRSLSLRMEGWGHSLVGNAYRTRHPHLGITLRPGTGGGQPFETEGLLLGYAYAHRWEGLQVRYGLAFDGASRHYVTAADGTDARRVRGHRLVHTGGLVWDLGDLTHLELGAALEERVSDYFRTVDPSSGAIKDENHLRDVRVPERSLLAQLSTEWRSFHAVFGLRYTHNRNFGRNLSGRATLAYGISERSALKLVWGQSYRAPSMLEQYTLVPGVLYGNLGARPETSDSLELEYLYRGPRLGLQLTAYQARFKDKLVRVPSYPRFTNDPSDPSRTFANGPAFGARGLEASVDVRGRRGLGGFLHLTLLKGDEGDRLPDLRGTNYAFVPSHWGDLGLSWRRGAWTCSALLSHEGSRQGPLAPLPSQTFGGLHVEFRRPWRGLELRHTLGLRNAFAAERRYPEFVRRNVNEIPDGQGRRFAYGLSCTF